MTDMLIRNRAHGQALALGGPINYLDAEEARLIEAREGDGLSRAWETWKRKVEINGNQITRGDIR